MDRRAFISGITGGFLAAPLAAGAQQAAKIPRVGVLGTSPPGANELFQAFRKGLQELGYVEGQHIHLDYRWPEGGREGYPALAAQLVQSRFDVILTMSNAPALAAKRATDTVPIVFCTLGDDPVLLAMVASLGRPGGNATGTVILSRELTAKRLDLLKEAVPGLSRAAVLWNASIASHPKMLQDVEEAARRLNIRVIPVEWKGPGDIEKAFQRARRERVGGVLALPSPETWRARKLPRLPSSIACRRLGVSRALLKLAISYNTDPTFRSPAAAPPSTWTASLREPTRPISPSSNLPNSSW
jgi:putative ABC transport system substrate-binding protein